MNTSIVMLTAIFFPILLGAVLLLLPEFSERSRLLAVTGAGLVITGILAVCALGGGGELLLFSLGDKMEIFFRPDDLGRIFAVIVTIVWLSLIHI